MEGPAQTKNIVIIGTLGIGKSSVMNTIAGQNEFKAGNSASGVTTTVSSYKFQKGNDTYQINDTPGLNDMEMDMSVWVANFKKNAKIDKSPVHMVILAFKANVRPTNEQKQDILVGIEAIKNISSDNIGILFTFCDGHDMKAITDDKVPGFVAWTKLITKCIKTKKVEIKPDNFFFFSGKSGVMGPATTQNDLLQWFGHVTPTQSNAVMNDQISVNGIVQSVQASGDPALIALMKQQIEDMKEMYEKMLDSKNDEHQQMMEELKKRDLDQKTMKEELDSMVKAQQTTPSSQSSGLGVLLGQTLGAIVDNVLPIAKILKR